MKREGSKRRRKKGNTYLRAIEEHLADARVEHGRLHARVGADEQNEVRLLEAEDG